MAKINYPTPVTGKEHAGLITNLRRALTAAGTQLDVSSSAGPDVAAQIQAFASEYELAVAPALPSTEAVVTDGQTLAVSGGTVTLAVTDGVVTATYTATPDP